MNLMNIVKPNVLNELKKGNKEVLQGLSPIVAMQYGLDLQKEVGVHNDPSPIDSNEVSKAMLEHLMADGAVKERLMKEIEERDKAFAEKVELAKQVTNEFEHGEAIKQITKEVTG
ncbi:hypothetical protein P4597_19275 [Peribacillus simplex]|uniref:hypothetical protein n=1 Tax=Peribacillus simplex TaxID=1478 RepID=UPI002E1C9CEE|nr:hypothetical protein [Peribacillus simplex]